MVVKTGVSLPDELYERLREIAGSMGYSSISRAVRDAVELFIAFNSWWNTRSPVKGVILAVTSRDHLQQLDRVHEAAAVKFYLVERLGETGLYMVVIGVEGDAATVKALYKELARMRGVRFVQPLLVPLARPPSGCQQASRGEASP